MRIPRHAGAAAAHKKIQVRPLMGLLHVLHIEPLPTSLGKRWRCPLGATCSERAVIDLQSEMTLVNIEADHVSGVNKSERTARSLHVAPSGHLHLFPSEVGRGSMCSTSSR